MIRRIGKIANAALTFAFVIARRAKAGARFHESGPATKVHSSAAL
jgi:hypothetical protein